MCREIIYGEDGRARGREEGEGQQERLMEGERGEGRSRAGRRQKKGKK